MGLHRHSVDFDPPTQFLARLTSSPAFMPGRTSTVPASQRRDCHSRIFPSRTNRSQNCKVSSRWAKPALRLGSGQALPRKHRERRAFTTFRGRTQKVNRHGVSTYCLFTIFQWLTDFPRLIHGSRSRKSRAVGKDVLVLQYNSKCC